MKPELIIELIIFISMCIMLFWYYKIRIDTRKIKEELQRVFDRLEPIAFIDRDYNIKRVNQQFAQSVDLSFQQVIGEKCYKIFENRKEPCLGCKLSKTLIEKKSQLLSEYKWTRDGHQVVYDIAFHPLFEDATLVGIVEVKADVSSLHAAKQEMDRQQAELKSRSTELKQSNENLGILKNELEKRLNEHESELKMARDIQSSLLPKSMPEMPNVAFHHSYIPAQSVGGDLFDFIPLGDFRVGIFIGDVSGHGLSASFIGFLARMSLNKNIRAFSSPARVLKEVNQDICRDVNTGHYLTAFLGIIDLKTNEFIYTRASHPYPLWLKSDGTAKRLDSKGMLLGMIANPEFSDEKIILNAGDRLFLFSDGCYDLGDIGNWNGFSYGNFSELIIQFKDHKLSRIYEMISEVMYKQFELAPELMEDDRTFIAFEMLKNPRNLRIKYLLHFNNHDYIRRILIKNVAAAEAGLKEILTRLGEMGYKSTQITRIVSSIRELYANAQIDKDSVTQMYHVLVAWSVTGKCFKFSLTDKTPEIADSTASDRRVYLSTGQGLLKVRNFMDNIWIDNQGHTVTMVLNRK
jgi:serine phosphatase RsbU (regulator of sigma subunit)